MKKKQSKKVQNTFTVVNVSPPLSNNSKIKGRKTNKQQKSGFIKLSSKKSREIASQLKSNEAPIKLFNKSPDVNMELTKGESTKGKRSRSKAQKKENLVTKRSNDMEIDQDESPTKRRRSSSKTSDLQSQNGEGKGVLVTSVFPPRIINSSVHEAESDVNEIETTKKRTRISSKARRKQRNRNSKNQVPTPSPNAGLTLKQKRLLSKQRQKLRKAYNTSEEDLEVFSKKWVARYVKKNERKSLSQGEDVKQENNVLNTLSTK